MSKIVMQLKDISKNYNQGKNTVEVLKNINLTIKTGELITITGSSGSGKSTLLHIAGLLDKASEGTVEINGAHSHFNNDLIRLNFIGFIYQYHHLLKDFNARENIALPNLIKGSSYKLALTQADEYLFKLGIADKRYHLPGELSGGEQQRVAIARSLINQPKIILADEPTGNLDERRANEIFELFLKITMSNDLAFVMVTHNNNLSKKSHKRYQIQDGTIVLT